MRREWELNVVNCALTRNRPIGAMWSGILVWSAWVAACVIATGLLVPSVIGNDFTGEVFWGGALGVTQCVVLWGYLLRWRLSLRAAVFVPGWAALSLLAWLLGVILTVTVDPTFVLPALYEPLTGWVRANEMTLYYVTAIPAEYGAMACGQWLLLRRYLHRAGWWIPASAVGGLLGWFALDAMLSLVPLAEADLPAWFPGVEGLVYGAITGAMLLLLDNKEQGR